jgi:outer membrane receptor protein involved in Fe transport
LVPHLSAPISALQAYNLGLPTLYQQGFGDSLLITWQPRINLFAQDTFTPRPGLTVNYGIRYEYEEKPKPVNTDTNNFAPRLSFAWNPHVDGKTVIRGG